jgi:hypothetical protein
MRVRFEHRIGIQAPASEIWQVLADLESWSAWNPLYPKAAGTLRIGAKLSLTEAVPGQPQDDIAPEVVDWVPDAQILWRDKTLGGLVKRLRYMEIEALSDEGCIFSNGEVYEGFGVRFMSKGLKNALRRGFTELGEALKATVEQRVSGERKLAGAGQP